MILHFDADAFFASVEQAADPKLRGRPMAVGGERRGIIASASYEARKLGIYTPMPTARAKKLCPGLIVLPCDFDKYERFSHLMFSYAYDFTPIVELASIDECYLDLHGARQTKACDAAAEMQKAIAQSLKLSVSVGVGANKLISQIASKLRKPHCFIEVAPGHERGFLWPLENKWLPLVGPQLAARLNTAGLRNVEHIARTPVDELSLLVGSGAPTLHEYALGHDLRPVICDAPAAKSYGEQETFAQDTTDTVFIIARLRAMADTLMRRVREDGKSIRTVTLRLRYNDMDEVTRSSSLDEPTDLEHDLYPLLQAMLTRAWERRVSIRLIGLRFTKIYEAGFSSILPLEQSDMKRERLHTLALVIDDLRSSQRSIMRGHDLWLAQQKNAPRQTLPKPKLVTDPTASVTNRVLRERPGESQIITRRSISKAAPALNVKSCYSFLDSTLTIANIIEAAVGHDMPAVVLMDPNLHAAVPFYQAATAAGIKPIIGAELSCDQKPLLAYVQNQTGYANLCHLLSAPKITPQMLHEHQSGLIIAPASSQPEIRYHKPQDKVFFDILQSMKTLTLLHEKHPQKRSGDFSFRRVLPTDSENPQIGSEKIGGFSESAGNILDLNSLEVGLLGGTENPPREGIIEPWSDPGVWNMIATGNGRGVHHIESPAMTSLACMADVRDIDRLVAIVSVIRPGAANGLKKAQFARRAQGLEKVEYTHESLAGVLRSTFGVVAYEEHILQICEAFAGLAPGRADVLRRALVKQDMKKIAEIRLEFIAAAHGRLHDETTIEKVWNLVAGFQGYAFCRAHSTAYAVEAYQGAYAKHYHPAEFMAAVLSNGKGFYSSLVYTLECRRLGIGFLPTSVNAFTDAFTVENGSIRVPLRCIKDLSDATLTRWRQNQTPFASIRDFITRVRPEAHEALNLIRCGAFDRLGDTRTEQFWHCLHSARDVGHGDDWLFRDNAAKTIRAQFRQEPSALQKLQDEQELLGYTVSGHPLDLHPQIDWRTYCPIADLHHYPNQRVTVCGLIIVSRSHLQQNGQPMKFISICDYSGIVECEIFAAAYRVYGLNTVRYPVVQVTAKVKPFDNLAGYTLEVLRVEQPRTVSGE